MLRLACVVLPVLPLSSPLPVSQPAWLRLWLLVRLWLRVLLSWRLQVWLLLPWLALLLGFFWLLPSSSLLNKHMGNCAINRTANIGGDLHSMQAIFTFSRGKSGEILPLSPGRSVEGRGRVFLPENGMVAGYAGRGQCRAEENAARHYLTYCFAAFYGAKTPSGPSVRKARYLTSGRASCLSWSASSSSCRRPTVFSSLSASVRTGSACGSLPAPARRRRRRCGACGWP